MRTFVKQSHLPLSITRVLLISKLYSIAFRKKLITLTTVAMKLIKVACERGKKRIILQARGTQASVGVAFGGGGEWWDVRECMHTFSFTHSTHI